MEMSIVHTWHHKLALKIDHFDTSVVCQLSQFGGRANLAKRAIFLHMESLSLGNAGVDCVDIAVHINSGHLGGDASRLEGMRLCNICNIEPQRGTNVHDQYCPSYSLPLLGSQSHPASPSPMLVIVLFAFHCETCGSDRYGNDQDTGSRRHHISASELSGA